MIRKSNNLIILGLLSIGGCGGTSDNNDSSPAHTIFDQTPLKKIDTPPMTHNKAKAIRFSDLNIDGFWIQEQHDQMYNWGTGFKYMYKIDRQGDLTPIVDGVEVLSKILNFTIEKQTSEIMFQGLYSSDLVKCDKLKIVKYSENKIFIQTGKEKYFFDRVKHIFISAGEIKIDYWIKAIHDK